MKIYTKLMKRAVRLVAKLQEDITAGRKAICENYGQREISEFIDKEVDFLNSDILTYQEKCNIKEVLYKVSSIC